VVTYTPERYQNIGKIKITHRPGHAMNSNDFLLSIGSEAFFEGFNALDDISPKAA